MNTHWMRVVILTSMLVMPGAFAATYVYRGSAFTEAGPPYALGGRVTGTLELVSALPPNMPASDIPQANFVDLLFVDGQQVRTGANTVICRLVLGTDALGRINAWNIWLRAADVTAGNGRYSLETYNISGFTADLVGVGVFANFCDSGALDPRALTQSPGSWLGDVLFANGLE